jgi:hypothetical protein
VCRHNKWRVPRRYDFPGTPVMLPVSHERISTKLSGFSVTLP